MNIQHSVATPVCFFQALSYGEYIVFDYGYLEEI